VPVSPKKEQPVASAVTPKVTENIVTMDAVNQVFPSTMVTEVGDVCKGSSLWLLPPSPLPSFILAVGCAKN
jgi:hypothetical protein